MSKLRIKASTFATKHYLEIKGGHVVWCESTLFGGKEYIAFRDIEVVLRGTDCLSLQVGRTVYKIRVKPERADHRTVMARLVAECRATTPRRPRAATATALASQEAG